MQLIGFLIHFLMFIFLVQNFKELVQKAGILQSILRVRFNRMTKLGLMALINILLATFIRAIWIIQNVGILKVLFIHKVRL